MPDGRRDRVESICLEALRMAGAARAAFLEAACAGDAALRQEVESLLGGRAAGSALLDTPAWTAVAAPLERGTRLGPYEVERVVDRGGMGEVYQARDTRLGRTVALKVIAGAAAVDPGARERFRREARAVAALNHPHICALHDVGREGDLDFLVLEYVEGETLERRLHGAGGKARPLKIDEALKIAAEMAEALSAAHRQGIVHRDLKPANVVLTRAGAKLLDFGLARLRETTEGIGGSSAVRTAPNVIVGTVPYMAPEQVQGEAVDARTDLFALGALIYEMVTGKRAFEAASPASVMAAILEHDPPPIASLQPLAPPALERLVRRCLAKSPDDRPDSAHDVAGDLRWLREVSAVNATATAPVWRRRLVSGSMVALAVVALLAAFVAGRLRPSPAAPVVRAVIDLPAGTRLTTGVVAGFPYRTQFAFSPDGRYLVFSASRDGTVAGAMLYLRALDSTEAEPVKGTEGAVQPLFSPDGKWIAFWANGKVSRVPTIGGIPTDLFASPSQPKGAFWSQDGTILLGGARSGITTIPADGGAARELTRVDPRRESEHVLPFLLPDGRTVLFTATPDFFGNRAQVEAVRLDGGSRQVVIQDAADARVLPTGHIVFVRRGVLMAAAFDPSRLAVGPPVPVVRGVEQALNVGGGPWHSAAGQFSVSPSGALAYASGTADHFYENDVVWVSRDGGTEPLVGFERSDVGIILRLSRDGRQLAFLQQAGPLWLFDLERSAYTRVSPADGLAAAPQWHPDGRRLTFAWSSAGTRKNWQVSVTHGSDTLESFAADAESEWPSSWSRDGRFLAMVGSTPATGSDILIYSAEDGKTRPFLHSRANELYPEFSPDGRWLAYASDESGRSEVYLRSFPDPSRKVQVSNQGGDQLGWSPNGRVLFYVSLPPRRMMKVDVNPSTDGSMERPQPLFDFPFLPCVPVRGYDIAPDGRRFLVTRTKRAPSAEITRINLVQNWFEELKAKVRPGR